ncbi:MAG: hypothetical protein MSH14_11010 [Bacteroidales bacterium]|nr:hypothetical protein [Bacteroidales bacterium]
MDVPASPSGYREQNHGLLPFLGGLVAWGVVAFLGWWLLGGLGLLFVDF